MKDFRDKVVVITGAGSGMGRAYAEEFGKLGARLALNDFNAATLNETVDLLKQQGVQSIYSEAFDVSEREAMLGFAANVEAALGKVHVVINNAGVEGAVQPGWEISEAAFERTMNINFWGVVNGSQAFLPQLLANDEGALVNVSSIFGLIGTPLNADYCASKFAVRGFTEAMMVELHDTAVDAYLVHPGGIATNIVKNEEAKEFAARYLITPPADIARYVIQSIRQRRLKIVYGESALRAWLASNFVPLKWLIKVLWRELQGAGAPGGFEKLKSSKAR